jgi:hypothetical protein
MESTGPDSGSQGDDFPSEVDLPVPSTVELDDERLSMVIESLARRDGDIRSPRQGTGPITEGERPMTIRCDGQEVAIPTGSVARAFVLDKRPGLLLESADPKPLGTWVWIAGAAAREINDLLRTLEDS